VSERVLLAVTFAGVAVLIYFYFRALQMRRASRNTSTASRPAVLYFRADWCAPCATQARFLEQIAQEFGDRLAIEKIDADRQQDQLQRFGVFTLPTTLVVDPYGVVRHANYGLVDVRKLGRQVAGVMSA
jgi:thiol-disulfide isomerase/thioredoxin